MLLRLLRIVAVALVVTAVWLGWRVYAQRPLREIRGQWTGFGIQWPHVVGERVVNSASSGLTTLQDGTSYTEHSVFEIDLKTERLKEILMTRDLKSSHYPPSLKWIAIAMKDGTVEIIYLPGGERRFKIPAFIPAADAASFDSPIIFFVSPDESLLVITAPTQSKIEIWDVYSKTRRMQLDASGPAAFSPVGPHVAAFVNNNEVGVWDVNTGATVATLPAPGPKTGNVMFLPDGRLFVAQKQIISREHNPSDIKIWSADFQRVEDEFETITKFPYLPNYNMSEIPYYMVFGDGELLWFSFSASKRLWDISVHPPRCLDDEIGGEIGLLHFHANGRMATLEDDQVVLCDWPSGRKVPLEKVSGRVSSVTGFSPSGRWFVAFTKRSTPRSSWREWLRERLPTLWTDALLPDGQTIIWDTQTGHVSQRLPRGAVLAWPTDEESVWMWMPTLVVSWGGSTPDRVYSLFPTTGPSPPLWLLLVSAGGAALVFMDIKSAFRRQSRHEREEIALTPA